MTKLGQVTEYDGETGVATITYSRPEACEKCGACGTRKHNGKIKLKASCQIGDWVRVELPDGRFMQATVLAYALPFVFFMGGMLAGYFLSGKSELIAALCAFIGLGLSVALIKLADSRIKGKDEWTPHVTAVYGQKPDTDDIGCGGHGLG